MHFKLHVTGGLKQSFFQSGLLLRAQLHCEEKKFKQKIAYADKLGIPYAVLLGEYELREGQQIVADTGNVAGFTAGGKMEIQQVPGMKNKLLGGEGLFNTLLTGPGRVWLQTMPISSVAASIRPYIPTGNG